MARRGENNVPNFKEGWEFYQAVYWMAIGPETHSPESMVRIGDIKIYFNQDASTMGWEYHNLQNQALFKIWERDVEYENRKRKLYYISWVTRDKKRKFFRIKIPTVKAVINKDKIDGKTIATVSIDLVITGGNEIFIVEVK